MGARMPSLGSADAKVPRVKDKISVFSYSSATQVAAWRFAPPAKTFMLSLITPSLITLCS